MFCEHNRTCNSAHRLHAQPVHMTLRLHFHLSNVVQMHHQSRASGVVRQVLISDRNSIFNQDSARVHFVDQIVERYVPSTYWNCLTSVRTTSAARIDKKQGQYNLSAQSNQNAEFKRKIVQFKMEKLVAQLLAYLQAYSFDFVMKIGINHNVDFVLSYLVIYDIIRVGEKYLVLLRRGNHSSKCSNSVSRQMLSCCFMSSSPEIALNNVI